MKGSLPGQQAGQCPRVLRVLDLVPQSKEPLLPHLPAAATEPFAVRASGGPRPNPGTARPPSQPRPAETVPTGGPLGGEGCCWAQRPKVDQIGTKSKGKDQTKGQSHHPKGTNKIGTTDICHTGWSWQFSAKLQPCVGSDSKEPMEDPWQAQGRSGCVLV